MWQRAIRTTKHSHFLFLYTSINLHVFDLTLVFPVAFSCKREYVLFLLCFFVFNIKHQQVFLSEIHLVRLQSLYSTAESFVVSESSSIPWHVIAFFKEKVPLMFTGKHTAMWGWGSTEADNMGQRRFSLPSVRRATFRKSTLLKLPPAWNESEKLFAFIN